MRLSFIAMCDSAIPFIGVWFTSFLHGSDPSDTTTYIGASLTVLCLSLLTIWFGSAMLAGRSRQTVIRRLRATCHLRRNSLLYLWAGGAALMAQTALLLNLLPTTVIKQLLSGAIVAFGVLLAGVALFPTRKHQQG